MATYQASMLGAAPDSVPGIYPFEAPDDLMSGTADQVVRMFFTHVDKDIFHHHVGYELNAALKNRDGAAVTAMGSLILGDDAHLPFVLVISH